MLNSGIGKLLSPRSLSQVVEPIVRRVAVYVVDLLLGKDAIRPKPCKTVRGIDFVVNFDLDSSFLMATSCYAANHDLSGNLFSPTEFTCAGIVIEQ